MNIILERY